MSTTTKRTRPTIDEKPMIFSAPMILSLLSGRKTMTRRIIKTPIPDDAGWVGFEGMGYLPVDDDEKPMITPAHPVGSRIWVKENYRAGAEWDDAAPRDIQPFGWDESRADLHYEADQTHPPYTPEVVGWGKLRPSIFMMRWMSRIELEVVGVKVERVQSISYDDAMAEGTWAAVEADRSIQDQAASTGLSEGWHQVGLQDYFRVIWERINGRESWARNDWTWCYSLPTVESGAE